MILEVDHPRFGTLREVASPIKTDGAALRAAGVFGPADRETTAS